MVDYPEERPESRISWGAVFAGALVALMLLLLIGLLALAAGFGTFDGDTSAQALGEFGNAASIGAIVAYVLALFLGGWATGRLANTPRGIDATLHGFLVWGVLTLLSFWLVTSTLGRVVSGATGLLGQVVSLAGQEAASVAPEAAQAVEDLLAGQGATLLGIRDEALSLAEEAGADPEAGQETADLAEAFLTGEGVEREQLVGALTADLGLAEAEAEELVDDWSARFEDAGTAVTQAQQELEETLRNASDAVGSAALWTFLTLLAGAVIAILGALVGRPKSLEEARAP